MFIYINFCILYRC